MIATPDGYVYFPSDLVTFLESPFAAWMDRYHADHPGELIPDRTDESADWIRTKGLEHEEGVLSGLEEKYGDVVRITPELGVAERVAATRRAMEAGAPAIYQAALRHGNFGGYCDVLVRVPGPSRLGDFHYEPWEIKLSRNGRPHFVIQLCCYAEMLAPLQGVPCRQIHIVLGNLQRLSLALEEVWFFYLRTKNRFLEFQRNFRPDRRPVPGLGENCGRWASHGEREIRERDHLCQVADITALHIRRLEQAGIRTLKALAGAAGKKVKGIQPPVLNRLIHQASLQLRSRESGKPVFELLDPPAGERRGLSLLPPESPSDIFFDMEGYPLAEGGLEYLFGASVMEGGELRFYDWWAHDSRQERKAFEEFIDWVHQRWIADPSLHVYHYGDYEISALRRLMGRYGTREDPLDDLLRNEVFVNLYAIVRQAMRVGEPSYSIKYLEKFYDYGRGGEVKLAVDSIVEYARWLEHPDGEDWRSSAILRGIRDYNRDDCDSTKRLTDWLRELQAKAGCEYVPRPQTESAAAPELLDERSQVAARFLATPESGEPEVRVAHFLGHIVHFHKREAKPGWWAYFDRLGKTEEELADDPECLAGLALEGEEPGSGRGARHFVYRFDPRQETKLKAGARFAFVDRPEIRGDLVSLERGRAVLKLSGSALKILGNAPRYTSLIPFNYVPPEPVQGTILAVVRGCRGPGEWEGLPGALHRFLFRLPPKVRDTAENRPLLREGEDVVGGACRIVAGLEESTLCIQGPPGAGKTYTAAHMILSLLAQGKRVGVTANSHAAINHLIAKVYRENRQGVAFEAIKIGGEKEDPLLAQTGCGYRKNGKEAFERPGASVRLVGGTAWAFCVESARRRLDYLFVDEAGQVSVAHLVGMSHAASNLVLIGDQRQLEQPTQGSHPGESGLSCLTYLLQQQATIAPEQGIFLAETRRLHPAICDFISRSFYEGRLTAYSGTERREVLPAATCRFVRKRAGIQFIPCSHEGNSNASPEEVEVVAALVEELRNCLWEDGSGKCRALDWEDILIVAPFNLQVHLLRERLGERARVGTVDLFQGREAPVVIVSMTSSAGDLSSRGADFLFSPNRLNVALSRAMSLALVVGCPDLALTSCGSLDKMRRLNLFCRILEEGSVTEMAREVAEPVPR